jgi:hypothetical protein
MTQLYKYEQQRQQQIQAFIKGIGISEFQATEALEIALRHP